MRASRLLSILLLLQTRGRMTAQALADEFTENFNYPDHQWDRISSPERIRAWIERKSAPMAPVRATA